MTTIEDRVERQVEQMMASGDQEEAPPSAAEVLAWRRDSVFLPEAEATPEEFPTLHNLSAGHIYKRVVRPVESEPPEYATITIESPGRDPKPAVLLSQWNMAWESAQFRRRYFDLDDLPPKMAKIAELGDVNVTFVPRTRSRYFEYAPLYHLLPKHTLDRFGLPILRRGLWPFITDHGGIDDFLAPDFEARLARAWAATVWPHLVSGSKMKGFTAEDPIRLLAHNLDFWVPAVTSVVQNRLREYDELDEDTVAEPVPLTDGGVLEGAVFGSPRPGGPVWWGEDDARDAVAETVDAADSAGRLRGILDAVRSNRAEDDFSSTWSFAREDFARKLEGKRRKVKVSFIEIPDTVPVQGPESEVLGNIVTNDFLALLDDRNRQIVVLLASGMTRKTEIAQILGYANHSAVSKRLKQIRAAAEKYFDGV
ncbi:sigma-70 family RNA polymerase sigma factor [Nocardia africana]